MLWNHLRDCKNVDKEVNDLISALKLVPGLFGFCLFGGGEEVG